MNCKAQSAFYTDTESLHLLYNVNFSIVSQVNRAYLSPLASSRYLYFQPPSFTTAHIHLFHFAPRGAPGRPVSHRNGKGWRGGFFLSAAEQFLKLELTKNFRVGPHPNISSQLVFCINATDHCSQVIRDLELLPELGGQNWSAVFLQKFEGTVTIFPKSRMWDWVRILDDPDRKELARMILVGQRVTWPKVSPLGSIIFALSN